MTRRGTHPPSPQESERYRQAGHWLPPRTAAEHVLDLSTGGSRTAVVDDASAWTYAQLAAAVDNVRGLLAQSDVTADDAVLIVAPLRNAAVAAYLGALYHGCVAVLLDRRTGTADVANAVASAQPRVALAFDDDSRRLGLPRHSRVLSLDGVVAQPSGLSAPDSAVDPDATATVVFTSGTTSAPKGVVHTINSLRCGAANMVEALQIGADDAFFLSSPLASITGVLQLHSAITVYAKVILEENFSAASALDRVRDHGATVIGGAPVIAETVFAEAERRNESLDLRCIAVGGSMIPQAVLASAARFGVRAVRVYGSSEAPFSTATALEGADSAADDGVPMAGVEIAIRDAGDTDELVVRGPHQFHGYLDASQNADAFADDWVRTGDQADIESGRMRIKGRLKEVVVRKGMKISMAEIDGAASGLGDCVAFGMADEETGERLVLAIRAPATAEVGYADVVAHLMGVGLAKWKLPEQIVVWDGAYPRTASGKIIRQRLVDTSRHMRTFYAPRISGS
ncbi:class I adenylate-forming enzyme family protein [Mycolicibacterium sp.]|uniref:class I adenylate-forming enzyme family protein n=1 Tax=Mycolicibacterium sp. TaxID=2320850 RepID=UPI001A210E28|nr:class I adenylate-forming enzyme family protein [Mycolicibacterium sp.]MBJ7337205.1 acyl--CoA ligase [Mycolicibacterium sp.]